MYSPHKLRTKTGRNHTLCSSLEKLGFNVMILSARQRESTPTTSNSISPRSIQQEQVRQIAKYRNSKSNVVAAWNDRRVWVRPSIMLCYELFCRISRWFGWGLVPWFCFNVRLLSHCVGTEEYKPLVQFKRRRYGMVIVKCYCDFGFAAENLPKFFLLYSSTCGAVTTGSRIHDTYATHVLRCIFFFLLSHTGWTLVSKWIFPEKAGGYSRWFYRGYRFTAVGWVSTVPWFHRGFIWCWPKYGESCCPIPIHIYIYLYMYVCFSRVVTVIYMYQSFAVYGRLSCIAIIVIFTGDLLLPLSIWWYSKMR